MRILCLMILCAAVMLSGSFEAAAGSAAEEWERLTARSLELYGEGRYDEAIQVSREALEAAETALGPGDPNVAKSMNNLGAMLAKHGDRAEAALLLTNALGILEETLGKGHSGTSSALNNLAELYSDEGRYDDAERLFLGALSIRENDPGDGHADLITTLENMGVLYMRMERFRDAEAMYSRVAGLREKYLGSGHPDVRASKGDLLDLYITEGNLLKAADRLDDAVSSYRRALEILDDPSGPDRSGIASLLETLAVLSVRTGDLEGAAGYYERLNGLNTEAHGAGSIESARSSRDLARVCARMERFEQAASLYESAAGIMDGILADDDPELIRTLTEQAAVMTSLAGSYVDSGRTDEAVPLFAGAIEIRDRTGKADDPSQAVRMNNLAGLLVGLGRYEEAERLYSEALEVLTRSPDGGPSHRTLILQNLGQLYTVTGDTEKKAAVDSLLAGPQESR